MPWSNAVPQGKKVAYGGVVMDCLGRVLLREPRNHFDGYVWTFPKGRPDPGETPEQTALREVREETGQEVDIVRPIQGEFLGGTTVNRFYLMRLKGAGLEPLDPGNAETVAICWAPPEEARTRLAQSTNPLGRARDLAILAAALEATRG
jgi:8-oxo-dGTP pyrophosphatase MutT (NUDIX family)